LWTCKPPWRQTWDWWETMMWMVVSCDLLYNTEPPLSLTVTTADMFLCSVCMARSGRIAWCRLSRHASGCVNWHLTHLLTHHYPQLLSYQKCAPPSFISFMLAAACLDIVLGYTNLSLQCAACRLAIFFVFFWPTYKLIVDPQLSGQKLSKIFRLIWVYIIW